MVFFLIKIAFSKRITSQINKERPQILSAVLNLVDLAGSERSTDDE